MDKQNLVDKTTETLRPFETANLIDTMQHLSLSQIFSNPIVLLIIFVLFFFGVFKRSKGVLLTLFSLIGVTVILRYAMPVPGDELSASTMLPFIGAGLVIIGVVIYFSFVKND